MEMLWSFSGRTEEGKSIRLIHDFVYNKIASVAYLSYK